MKLKLIQRIIVSPLMLLLLLLYHLFHAVERWVSYLRHGGEVITYDKDSRKTIQDVYELVLKQMENKWADDPREYHQWTSVRERREGKWGKYSTPKKEQ